MECHHNPLLGAAEEPWATLGLESPRRPQPWPTGRRGFREERAGAVHSWLPGLHQTYTVARGPAQPWSQLASLWLKGPVSHQQRPLNPGRRKVQDTL